MSLNTKRVWKVNFSFRQRHTEAYYAGLKNILYTQINEKTIERTFQTFQQFEKKLILHLKF